MFKRYLKQHLLTLLITVVLLGIGSVLTMGLLAYTNEIAAGGISDVKATLVRAMSLLLGLLLITTAGQYILARLGAVLIAQLRSDLAARFLAIDYEKIAGKKQAIFTAAIGDLQRIGSLTVIAPQLLYNALLVLLCSAYLMTISLPLFGIFMSFMAAVAIASGLVIRFTKTRFDQMRSAEESFFEHLRTINDGKKELTLNERRAAHFTENLLTPSVKKAQGLMTQVHLGMGINASWTTFALNCAAFAVVLFGYTLLNLPAASIVKFVIGGMFVVGPLSMLAQTSQMVGLGLASLRHLERIGIDLQSSLPAPAGAGTAELPMQTAPADWSRIDIEDLVYRYPCAKGETTSFGVGPVSLSVRRGETIFLVGGNGSGKSTLLLTLCGLLTPQHGNIRLDGVPVAQQLDRYRQLFGGTFGDCFVFRHVLDSAGEVVGDEAVSQLLRRFNLAGQVHVTQGELSKLKLSTGQRKRLALIQTLAEDRDIFFFDEWAAEQDPESREHFYYTVLPELKKLGKTIMVISHDDRYFHVADQVIKLDAGIIMSNSGADEAPQFKRSPSHHHIPIAAQESSPADLVDAV